MLLRVQRTLSFVRNFSKTNLINTWDLKVKQFSKLNAELNNCKLCLKPLDPIEYLDGNLVKVQAYGTRNSTGSNYGADEYDVVSNEDANSIFLRNSKTCPAHTLIVSTPPIIDVNIRVFGHSSVHISNIESLLFNVHSDQGDIIFHNIKAQEIHSTAKDGNITSTGVLQGNTQLTTFNGSIIGEKLQAPTANLHVTGGTLFLSDVYTDRFDATNNSGDINIQSLHGVSELKCTEGNINVGTVEGNINASTNFGNVNIFAAIPSMMNLIATKGNVHLSFLPEMGFQLDLKAINLLTKGVDEKSFNKKLDGKNSRITGSLNGGGPLIKARAEKGEINLKSLLWMQRITEFRRISRIKAS